MGGEVSREDQIRFLIESAVLFAEKKACNTSSFKEWTKIVSVAHRLGYLYCGFDNGHVDLACIAYRIKDENASNREDIPEREEGNVLFVNALASKSNNKKKLVKLMKWYMKNNLEVKTISYNYRGTDKFRTHKVRR